MSYQDPNQPYGPPQPPTGQWAPPPPPPKKKRLAPILIGVGAFVIVLGVIGAVTNGSSDTAGSTPATTTAATATSRAEVTTTSAPATKTVAPAPKVVLKEDGSGIKSTATFTVDGDWDLAYTYDCSAFGFQGNFIVNGPEIADFYVNELGMKGSDVTHLHDGGQTHLEINSECAWTITVTDI